ncbi:NAD-dependent epimerase/dehydratase family protein [Curtobacterium sp. BRD11]|uniref:NAD-dependent epimerase/dehydratase family protein n=1 Tax=Curtobacterium sp. BRD11 TaxID=2962581 RepID=UPI002881A2F8|nr:NAD-dependent epimerase/dehydratase family protein [Curtobacterium sp. BRD11]MDT0212067.1 NAD-dependent epimerase/dehydratase family protein [Curtobacterium sp. BRD11]
MRIVITGVAGLIGSNLSRLLLEEGHDVVGIDDLSGGLLSRVDSRVRFKQLDIAQDDLDDALAGAEAVFHLAAYSAVPDCQENPARAISTNALGTFRVFDAMRRTGVHRLIQAETSAVYEGTSLRPTPESENAPQTVYAFTKQCGASVVQSLAPAAGIAVTTLRYFNVYGAGHDYRRVRGPVIASFIGAILREETPVIYGDGSVARDFIHVDDVNSFHLLCLEDNRTSGQTFNLGTGKAVSVDEILNLVRDEMSSDARPQYVPTTIPEAPLTIADIERAKALGWHPTIDLALGVRKCIAEARDQLAPLEA